MKILKTFVNKCLSLSYLGENWNNNLIQSIIEAGRTISYVETLNPSKTDKFHLEIKQRDEKTFMHEFEKVVRFAIAKLKLKKVKIAFDTTEDLTWMKESYNLRPSAYDKHLPAWQYLNVSIVEPFFLPLMSIPYRQIDHLDNLVIDLLNYMNSLRLNINLILFDRGFYHGYLIDYLENRKGHRPFPYLMLVPKKGKIKDFANETQNFKYYEHVIKYNKNQSTWRVQTKIIARRIDEKTCWCYVTNQKPSLFLVSQYGKRWNIETGFRIHDEARIKSKSRHSVIRFFYHLLGMLLVVLWRIQNKIKYYVFKRYLKYVEYQFYPNYIKEVLPPP